MCSVHAQERETLLYLYDIRHLRRGVVVVYLWNYGILLWSTTLNKINAKRVKRNSEPSLTGSGSIGIRNSLCWCF